MLFKSQYLYQPKEYIHNVTDSADVCCTTDMFCQSATLQRAQSSSDSDKLRAVQITSFQILKPKYRVKTVSLLASNHLQH